VSLVRGKCASERTVRMGRLKLHCVAYRNGPDIVPASTLMLRDDEQCERIVVAILQTLRVGSGCSVKRINYGDISNALGCGGSGQSLDGWLIRCQLPTSPGGLKSLVPAKDHRSAPLLY
jgi:hypothetical protein